MKDDPERERLMQRVRESMESTNELMELMIVRLKESGVNMEMPDLFSLDDQEHRGSYRLNLTLNDTPLFYYEPHHMNITAWEERRIKEKGDDMED